MNQWVRLVVLCVTTATPIIVTLFLIKRIFFSNSTTSKPSSQMSLFHRAQTDPTMDTIELTIDGAYVGFLIGRRGERIKKFQTDANVKITFRDNVTPFQQSVLDSQQNTDRVAVITGRPEFTEMAKIMIEKIIDDKIKKEKSLEKNLEMVLNIPEHLCGKIIGQGGQNIRNLQSLSGAKIKIDNSQPLIQSYTNISYKLSTRNCIITGTADEIRIATNLIEEIIEKENERHQRRNRYRSQNFHNLNHPNIAANFSHLEPHPSISIDNNFHSNENIKRRSTSLMTDRDRICLVYFSNIIQDHLQVLPLRLAYFTVFISALDMYGYVWVQLSGDGAQLLDQLIEKMTDRYSSMQRKDLSTGI